MQTEAEARARIARIERRFKSRPCRMREVWYAVREAGWSHEALDVFGFYLNGGKPWRRDQMVAA